MARRRYPRRQHYLIRNSDPGEEYGYCVVSFAESNIKNILKLLAQFSSLNEGIFHGEALSTISFYDYSPAFYSYSYICDICDQLGYADEAFVADCDYGVPVAVPAAGVRALEHNGGAAGRARVESTRLLIWLNCFSWEAYIKNTDILMSTDQLELQWLESLMDKIYLYD